MCLWDWHFYYSCLYIDGRIMFWFLKNLSLTLRGTLERVPKVISNQDLFSWFQSWCWTSIQKMNSEDKAFLEKFCVKESSSLVGLEIFGGARFSITIMLEWYPSHKSKSNQIFSHQSPPTYTKYSHSPHESLTPTFYYFKWEIKV